MPQEKYYETLYLVRPETGEEDLKAVEERLAGAIKGSGGEILKAEKWGERQLAYKINNTSKGVYYILVYKGLPKAPVEVERILRGAKTDVLRFLTLNIDEETALRAAGIPKAVPEDGGRKKKARNLIVKKKYGARFNLDTLTPRDIDYKRVDLLQNFITERKKIVARRTSGLSSYGQRLLANAIKRARIMALLPFTVLHD
jgi:small subunit ribosomal protein S6